MRVSTSNSRDVRRSRPSSGAGREQTDHELGVIVGGQHQDLQVGVSLPKPAGGRRRIQIWHVQIQEEDIGLEFLDCPLQVSPVVHLTDQLEVIMSCEDLTHAFADNGVVVGV